MKHPNAHPHRTLIANEEYLQSGQGLFRISFWKDEPTMLRWARSQSGTELIVMQRVRADHAFLQTFTRESDDSLPDSAWLYWQKASITQDQSWSSDGIAKTDIEVLDFDGTWRSFVQSEIMETEEWTFRKLGFDAYRYLYGGQVPATVFGKGQFVMLDGAMQFVVLIVHPLTETPRVYNSPRVFEHVFHEVRRHAVNVTVANCRLFIMDDAKRSFDPYHLAEVPLGLRQGRQRKKVWAIAREAVTEGAWTIDFSEPLRWHASQSEVFANITDAFALPLQRERIQRSMRLLQHLEKNA